MSGCGCLCGMCAVGMHGKCHVRPHLIGAAPADVREITNGACPTPAACNARMGCNGACARIFLGVRHADPV